MNTTEQQRTENRERARVWRARNPEQSKAHCRKYRRENAEKIREQKRRYYQEVRKPQDQTPHGRLKDRLKKSKRAAMKHGAEATLTLEEWLDVCKRYDYRCAYCGRRMPLEQDHVVAITKNGPHTKDNVVPACKHCNSSKGNRSSLPVPCPVATKVPARVPNASLDETKVRQIRSLAGSMTQKQIANVFGIHQTQVSRIILRRAWAWVP